MIKLSKIFTDGALLQRGQPLCVWGYADCEVEVYLSKEGGKPVKARVESCGGKFKAFFGAVSDFKSKFTLCARGGGESVSAAVRFGDLYLAIGQSNMSYSLSAVENCREIAERAANAEVAFLDLHEKPFTDTEQLVRPYEPLEDFDCDYVWKSGGGDLNCISALAVASAAVMYEKTGVPTGFIIAATGGLSVEAYMPREYLESSPVLLEFTKRAGRYQTKEQYNRIGARNYTQLSGIYNQKISPLIGLRFSGIAWYLGESSALDFEFAQMLRAEMQIIVSRYTSLFGGKFAAVEIAPEYYPYGDRHGYEYVNEALASLENDFDNYLYIPIYDIEPRWLKPDGDLYYHPIHPVNKLPVAERIASAFTGGGRYPKIINVRYSGGVATATADCELCGGTGGFTLAGSDGIYYEADAKIDGRKITVSSPFVTKAANLTYAFKLYRSDCTLKSESGLPVVAYRSECEPIDGDYFFTPPYLTLNGNVAYENCFGYTVGTCRKTKVWTDGKIYGAAPADIKVENGVLTACAAPCNDSYFMFGYSPEICLSGHKSHLNDRSRLNFKLCAESDGEVTFMGVVARHVSGDVYRFNLINGGKIEPCLPVYKQYADYCIDLTCGVGCDEAPLQFGKELRDGFAEIEFIFRCARPVKVQMRGLRLGNADLQTAPVPKRETAAAEARADTQLPS